MFSRSSLEQSLKDAAEELPAGTERAAVAMVFRFAAGYPEVLLMQRASRENDPWSGQVSLPGGRYQAGDPDLRQTAMRETLEEVGVDLSRAHYLGQRRSQAARARSISTSLVVVPFVFTIDEELELRLGGEAQSAFWLRCDHAVSGTLDGQYTYEWQGKSLLLPCWNYQGYVVWGLTHLMLSSFFSELSLTRGDQASAVAPKPR